MVTTSLLLPLLSAFAVVSPGAVVGFGILPSSQIQRSTTAVFAVTSSSSPKKRKVTNRSKGGVGGFGKKEAPPVLHTPDGSAEISTLIEFLSSNGSEGIGTNGGNEIGYSKAVDGLRGMFATRDFKKGEIMLKIPSALALALSDPALGGEDAPTQAHGGLNFMRMYSRNPGGMAAWEAYLDTLPGAGGSSDDFVGSTPDFFTDEEIDALEFPRAVERARERRDQVNDLAEKEGVPVDDLRLATWIVSSRSFRISITPAEPEPSAGAGAVKSEKKGINLLLPYIDMVNHSSDHDNAELHLIDPELDDAWFAIRAKRNIKAGREILIGYGSGTDSTVELLLNYGFVPEENRFDALLLRNAGEGCIDDLEGWKTTLKEDELALEQAKGSEGNMETVLRFRTKLKRSYP